jgi:acetylglutamate kinase
MGELTFRDRATLLLSNLEEGREVRTYLKQFAKAGGGCFAVLKVGGAQMAQEQEALADRLCLLQALGLTPVVVYGSGPQLDSRLATAGFETERKDGLRCTSAGAMRIVAAEAARTGLALIEAIGRRGGRAMLAPPTVLTAAPIDEKAYGRVGAPADVDVDEIEKLLRSGAIPLVGCVHADAEARLLNVNADSVARAIARALQPMKIVFLTATGGLLDADERVIDSINLVTDYEALTRSGAVTGGMALKLDEIKALLDALPLSSSVSITNVRNLVRELFTYGGAGTLVRRGERILTVEVPNRRKLTPLLEKAFGRRLREDYWERDDIARIIHTENWRAAALVTSEDGQMTLDKFAVTPEARGEGLAKAVWSELRRFAPSLIWRSQPANPFNAFYGQQADGMLKIDPWHVFWYGMPMNDRTASMARRLAAQPPDFTEVRHEA